MDDPENGLPDFEIVQAVRGGDREAFAELVRRHQQGVFRLCLAVMLNRAEAEDAAQDTFYKAFVSLDRYTEDHSFPAWLHRIASNQCLDLLRKRTRQKTDSLDGFLETGAEPAQPFDPTSVKDAPEAADGDSRTGLAAKVLGELPIGHRQILLLREIEGLRYDQIAATLGCTLDAVKARLRRARQALQAKARHFYSDGALETQRETAKIHGSSND